jgi:protein-S-isoprenylcysteine O-methyltransferase Ste14
MTDAGADVQAEIHKWVEFLWVGFFLLWGVAALAQKRTVRRESAASRLGYVLVAVVGGIVLAPHPGLSPGLLSTPLLPKGPFYSILGFGLTIAGLAFAIWARVHLGRNWSGAVTIKENHELIRSGPYAEVRHPIYSGILLALLGTVIVLHNTRWLLVFGLGILALRLKSLREEEFMTQQFGAEYVQYKQRVKALIPFLW